MTSLSKQDNNFSSKSISNNGSFNDKKNRRAIIEVFVDKYLDIYFENHEKSKRAKRHK